VRVIATAGHVDHGKSTLIRALTGMEPDRWEEERRRGLTIGLGFAWTTLPGGERVAFVDVPGHERFVSTMLAGVGPVPAVLFVVAADEGWMPQSTEHLAALDALGVRHGLLVVTRRDLADPAPALAVARERIARTSLGEVAALAVSAATGAGLDELRPALATLAGELPSADPAADVRLWVDRCFTIGGAGTVVTGTLAGGTLRAGDELRLAGRTVRVRGLQALGEDVPEVFGPARVAVNLRGVDRARISRGDALLTSGAWLSTDLVDVAHTGGGELSGELMFHIGSAAVPARVRPLGTRCARLRLRTPLPLRVGDRALLRDPGRHLVVAGLDVLDVRPPALDRRGAGRRRAGELAELADGARDPVAAQLAHRGFLRGTEIREMGLPEPGWAPVAGWYLDPGLRAAAAARAPSEVDAWSRDHPLREGIPVETLRQRLGLPGVAVTAVLAREAGLTVASGVIRGTERRVTLPPSVEAAVAALTKELTAAPFVAPDANRLRDLGLGPRELAAAERVGRLVRISEEIVLLPDFERRATEALAGLPQPFTLSKARISLGTTRRVVVPLLELLARKGITERLADGTHRLRR
jgi:selenocysteine-specific elongation factor